MNHDFFHRLSDAARAAIDLAEELEIDDKGEGDHYDPVTQADRGAERAMRAIIERAFPDDGIWGEEFGWSREGAARHWSIDPIDGTRAFVCGLPSWAVLVGVIEKGQHVAGMIDLPDLDERLVALDGETLLNGEQVRVSDCASLAEARISTTDPALFNDAQHEGWQRLYAAARLKRYGLDAMAFARVATGGLDLACDTGLKPHDYDAIVAVVRGAGGHVGNWSGGDDLSGGDVIATSSYALYEQAIEAIRG
ncbi:inositol monophosphatase family protein [Sphingomicrobium flavum]|uniref:inositol monophosphatase family protein n=1 Tax=Sphingomicrobium flavum TaxID=1229164 RepID=UPI0021ADEAD0|nr:inositol monophosphatase family protein [Sphingomicrobium flavum]